MGLDVVSLSIRGCVLCQPAQLGRWGIGLRFGVRKLFGTILTQDGPFSTVKCVFQMLQLHFLFVYDVGKLHDLHLIGEATELPVKSKLRDAHYCA
jgi:hypothetical protein